MLTREVGFGNIEVSWSKMGGTALSAFYETVFSR